MGFDDGTMTDAKGVRTITPFLDRRNFDAEVNFFYSFILRSKRRYSTTITTTIAFQVPHLTRIRPPCSQ